MILGEETIYEILLGSGEDEVQGSEHINQDSGKSHMEVRESLYMPEIDLPDDSHRKKIESVK